MANTVAEAQALAKKKKLLEAVQLLQKELKNCVSKQEALMWRLALCRMLIGSKRIDMALPHLELITKDIENYKLETWKTILKPRTANLKPVSSSRSDG